MTKDHLLIHKHASLALGYATHYLVNTYYDYVNTHYFVTRKDAEEFVAYQQHFSNLVEAQE